MSCQAPVLAGSTIAQFIHEQLIDDLKQNRVPKVKNDCFSSSSARLLPEALHADRRQWLPFHRIRARTEWKSK